MSLIIRIASRSARRVAVMTIIMATAALAAVPAQASLITDISGVPAGATLEDFNSFTTPVTPVTTSLLLPSGVTLVNNGSIVNVGQQNFSDGNNGNWDTTRTGYVSMDGSNHGNTPFAMTFQFPTPVSTVAFFMNYGFINANVSLIARGTGGSALEAYNLIFTPGGQININIPTEGFFNNGRIRGISRPSADITSFEIQGDFVTVDDLRFVPGAATSAPEPASLALILLAGAGYGVVRRRR